MWAGIGSELSFLAPLCTMLSPQARVNAKGLEAFQRGREIERSGDNPNGTIFSKMIQAGDAGSLTEHQIASEASNLLVAGSDTTSTSTTYAIWAVLNSDERIRKRLIEEVKTLPDGFTSEDAFALPYLKDVLKETLRLYGASPGQFLCPSRHQTDLCINPYVLMLLLLFLTLKAIFLG